jgi:RecJ-like exonuclease
MIKDNCEVVYICDLGLNEKSLDELERIGRFAELIYVDHHHLNPDLLKTVRGIGVKLIHDLRDCASALTFDLFKEALPHKATLLPSYAAVSDRLEDGPIAKKIIQKLDRDFVLFEATLLSYAIEIADIRFKKQIINQLSKLGYPHQIEGIPSLALHQANRIAVLRDELPSRASTLGNIVYVEAKDNSPGIIANLLLDVCDADIGICYDTNSQKQISDVSLRCKAGMKLNLGIITSQVAKRFGGFGGGHPRASGARIPTPALVDFIRAIHDRQ